MTDVKVQIGASEDPIAGVIRASDGAVKLDMMGELYGYRSSDGTFQPLILDKMTNTLAAISYEHHEIHDGHMFSASHYNASVAAVGTINVYIKTPATAPFCHAFAQWQSGGAASFRIYEAPTITANTGTNGQTPINHNRNSINPSGVFDNATVPVANRYGIDVTKTADGTAFPVEYDGIGKQQAGGQRGENEYIFLPNTVYLFEVTAVGNNITLALQINWYEHTSIA